MNLSLMNFEDLPEEIVTSASSSREDGNLEIQIGDDFPYKEAQFEIKEFVGDSQVKCVVMEIQLLVIFKTFLREFVRDRLLVNY
jgi:hypothetical protein